MEDEIAALAQGEVAKIWGDVDVDIQRLVATNAWASADADHLLVHELVGA